MSAGGGLADEGHAGHEQGRQGRLRQFLRARGAGRAAAGVAMLHSFWYSAGEKAFRDVLAEDPGCAIATWGIASILMKNPLAGQGASPKGAEQAQAAIDQGRRIGAEDRARARLHRGGRRVLRRTSPARPERARQAGSRQGLRGARGAATRTTTRRRSSPRSTSPARRPRPTRPTPPTSKAAGDPARSSSEVSRPSRASRTT